MSALFDGDDRLFLAAIDAAKVYGEYGMGASTLWVDAYTDAAIIGVDTSADWVAQTSAAVTRPGHILRHIDVGPVAKWGKPRSYRKRRNFIHYVEGPWNAPVKPDVVLVDGRFRVASFLTTLIHADPGCVVVFDDYVGRRTYHIVEEVLRASERSDRQAAFVVPEDVDLKAVTELRDQFMMVTE
ncbi:hypothetical protein [Hasllibacter sp. MH4015]|uniref:hypothetical protein n=1 Tax=Hasllibacter sp. MH4015 TaxID=2854029 RepID=UPI001CD7D05E|nr:hypothetical protein [Hasllibacter sp. MH4015]